MVLMFELYLLRGEVSPIDRVVAWGVFPVVDCEFNVISGKYKVPMARGIVNHRIQMFEKLEKYIAADVDNWLGNLWVGALPLLSSNSTDTLRSSSFRDIFQARKSMKSSCSTRAVFLVRIYEWRLHRRKSHTRLKGSPSELSMTMTPRSHELTLTLRSLLKRGLAECI